MKIFTDIEIKEHEESCIIAKVAEDKIPPMMALQRFKEQFEANKLKRDLEELKNIEWI